MNLLSKALSVVLCLSLCFNATAYGAETGSIFSKAGSQISETVEDAKEKTSNEISSIKDKLSSIFSEDSDETSSEVSDSDKNESSEKTEKSESSTKEKTKKSKKSDKSSNSTKNTTKKSEKTKKSEESSKTESSKASTDISTLAVESTIKLSDIEAFNGNDAYVVINDNQPDFGDFSSTESAEFYSELDKLGRCGTCVANIGTDLMPTEKRGKIGSVKPSGWKTVKYDGIDGKYLYNRCHLIGYQLSGENANEKNLITGTRYLNVDGMLPFENMVADYVKESKNHVLYRVTPIYDGDNLVASGVQIEAKSIEDNGEGILFNVYCYNSQPGIVIDYSNGESYQEETASSSEESSEVSEESQVEESSEAVESSESTVESSVASNEQEYVLNTNTKKFHKPSCRYVNEIKDENKLVKTATKESIEAEGYSPCKVCFR